MYGKCVVCDAIRTAAATMKLKCFNLIENLTALNLRQRIQVHMQLSHFQSFFNSLTVPLSSNYERII